MNRNPPKIKEINYDVYLFVIKYLIKLIYHNFLFFYI